MRTILLGFFMLVVSSFALADHHALSLEARQARTEMTITSIDLGNEESVITAEANMGEYGRTYASYHLSYNRDGNGGTYTAQGRGYVDDTTMLSAYAAGTWHRDGVLIVMDEIVNLSDGTQNLGRIVVNPLARTMVMDVYILK